MGFHCAAQCSSELMGLWDPPAIASQVVGLQSGTIMAVVFKLSCFGKPTGQQQCSPQMLTPGVSDLVFHKHRLPGR